MQRIGGTRSSESSPAILYADRKRTKECILINDEPFFQGSKGDLARAISKTEAKEELKHTHDLSYGVNDISL